MKLESLSKQQLIEEVKKLQMSDDRFHSLVAHTSDSIFCYEYNPPISISLPISKQIEMLHGGILVECNDIAAKSYGYTRASEVLGKSLLELFRAPPGSLNDFFRSFIENEYRTINAEAQETLEDGSKRFFLNNGHAAIKNGYIERIWGTYREITVQKKTEEALRESEEKYRLLVERSLLGVAILQDRKYVYVNSSFAKITGHSVEKLLSLSPTEVWTLIHPEDQASLETRNIDLEKGKPLSPRHRFRYIRKNGEIRWVEAFVTTISYEGKPALQVFEHDITEQINAEKIKQELEERRDNFITMTNHELRTPLTVISGYLTILARRIDEMEPSQRKKIFQVMQNNVNRLELLAGQVTLLSQFEKDFFTLNISRFNFYSFFQKAVEPYRILLGDKFQIKGLENNSKLMIEADKERLIQVLENIINNAVDHTASDQRMIQASFETLPNIIKIKITDNGAGIAPENLKRIFEQFVSIETKYSVKGTGIGLYLSKLIMKSHGGTIRAHSRGIDQGSTFIIELPKAIQNIN
ncbi:MAG: PAS domain-containing sensor histidine kinase [Candidatus Hodarchaeales archaeon]|jgi:PAS domain S-box-containing protein